MVAAHGLDTRLVQRSAPEVRSEMHGGDVAQIKGGALLLADDDVLEVGDTLYEAYPADEVLDAVPLDYLGTDVDVAFADRLEHFHEGHPVCAHAIGMEVDLILLDEAADARDFAHAFDSVELEAYVPVLDRA